MLTVRCCKILNELLQTASPLNKDALMEKYQVSERSIKYDMNRLRSWLQAEQTEMLIKYVPKTGFVLVGTEAAREKLRQVLNRENDNTLFYATERAKHIIFILLTSDEYVTISALAQQLSVSKDSIIRDIELVSDMLGIWNIYLQRKAHWGIRVATTEIKRRQVLEYFILSLLDARALEETLAALKNGFLPSVLQSVLNRYFLSESETEQLCRLYWSFLEGIRSASQVLDAKSSVELLVRISVSLRQIKSGSLLDDVEASKDLYKEPYLTIAAKLQDLFTSLQVALSGEEQNWLLLPLLKDMTTQPAFALSKVTLQLIQRTSHVMKIPFTADGELYDNLLLHLTRTFVKKQFYAVSANPILEDILHNYEELFNVVKQICFDIFSEYHVYLHDEDISYIVLYFQLSYETMFGKERIRTLVVCSTGVSSAKLLLQQLKNQFDELQIMGCCSVLDVDKVIRENPIDLVISVLQLQIDRPCVVVNALLHKDDLRKIRDALADFKLRPVAKLELPNKLPQVVAVISDETLRQEQFTQEVIVQGYNILLQLKEELGAYLSRENEAGLILHCLLMANRLACGTPYTNIAYGVDEKAEPSHLKACIKAIIHSYYPEAPESELIAVENYFASEVLPKESEEQ